MTNALDMVQRITAAIDEAGDRAVVEELRRAADPVSILEELSRSDDLEIRGWVPAAARHVLGREAVPLLLRMAEDVDPDVRGLATDALHDLDPELLKPVVPLLRRRLTSSDDSEVISSAWRLAALGDRESVSLIKAFLDRHDAWTWQHKAGTVIMLVLNAPEEVPRRIRAHDHEHMMWLAYAAVVLASPDSLDAVSHCSTSADDETCRRACSHALKSQRMTTT